jgi:hypothetical protein
MNDEEEVVVYDVEEAAAEVAKRTKHELDLVEEVLEAEFIFNAALGFYEIPDDEEGDEFNEEIRIIREKFADILPPADQPIDDYDAVEEKLIAFITRLIDGVAVAGVEAILDEHILYLEEKGILEPAEVD